MSEAANYWERAEMFANPVSDDPLSLPRDVILTRTAALRWLSRPKWTVLEAVLLFTHSDPEGWADPYYPDEEIRRARPLNKTEEEIEAALISSLKIKNIGSDGAKFFTLEGATARGLQHTQWEDLSFPVSSYVAWAYKTLFPNFKKGHDLQIFGLFHDPEKEAAEDTSQFFGVFEPIEQDFLQILQKIGADEKFAQWESEAVAVAKEIVSHEEALADAFNRHNMQVHQEQRRNEAVSLVKDETEVIDGLTVAGVRAALKYSPALRDIVAAVADWQKPATDGGELPRRSVTEKLQLKQAIENKATAGNWGTNKGKLSEPYGRVIERLIFGKSSGGSGNSSAWYESKYKPQKKTKKKGQ